MSQRRLRVVKNPYTKRDRLDRGRFNLSMRFELVVHENSYLFIGGTEYSPIRTLSTSSRAPPRGPKVRGIGDRREGSQPVSIDEVYRRFMREYSKKGDPGVAAKILEEYGILARHRPSTKLIRLDGKIIIPASTLKGCIRSRLEYKFNIINGSVYSCYAVVGPITVREEFYKRHVALWGDDVLIPRHTCSPIRDGMVCMVCDLFGAPGLASRIYFGDAYPLTDIRVVRLRYGGAIFELIPPSTRFSFRLDAFNIDFRDLALLFLGAEIFDNKPILLGRWKYRFNPRVGGDYNGRFFGLAYIKPLEIEYSTLRGYTLKDLIEGARRELSRIEGRGIIKRDKGWI